MFSASRTTVSSHLARLVLIESDTYLWEKLGQNTSRAFYLGGGGWGGVGGTGCWTSGGVCFDTQTPDQSDRKSFLAPSVMCRSKTFRTRFLFLFMNSQKPVVDYIYVICQLGGPYGEKLWPTSWKCIFKAEVTVFHHTDRPLAGK